MIKIYSGGEKISYTSGDTFILNVSATEGFEENTVLKFYIAKNEVGEYIIDSEFSLSEGRFTIELTDEEKSNLQVGEYIYKMTIVGGDGKIVTQKSGEFTVKWGA